MPSVLPITPALNVQIKRTIGTRGIHGGPRKQPYQDHERIPTPP